MILLGRLVRYGIIDIGLVGCVRYENGSDTVFVILTRIGCRNGLGNGGMHNVVNCGVGGDGCT